MLLVGGFFMNFVSIAIDGPAGAGKSTIAKNVAKALNIHYVDTGAMYRTIAFHCLGANIDLLSHEAVVNQLKNLEVKVSYKQGAQHMLLNDKDVTESIRSSEVSDAASKIAVYPEVREYLVNLQQKLADSEDVIMDGRDIGTYVLPNADLKIYLTASVDKRAQRRYGDLLEKGHEANLEQIKKDIEQRDYRDMNREFAPLKKADDAIEVDTSDMNIQEVTDHVIKCYKQA